VLQANLEIASGLTSDDPLLLVALGSKGASEDFSRQMNFTEMYMMLSILHASRSIPVHAHGACFDVKDAQADVIARVFAMAGLGLTLSRLVVREILEAVTTFLGLLCIEPACEIAAVEREAVLRRMRGFGSGL
jgi:hypothetical protein